MAVAKGNKVHRLALKLKYLNKYEIILLKVSYYQNLH